MKSLPRTLNAKRQRGAALIVALMILVIVSLLGISAMRASMFNAKISTSVQAASLAFQGAESAVSAAIEEASSDPAGSNPDSLINDGIENFYVAGYTMYRCVTASAITAVDCSSSDRIDTRGVVQSRSKTVMSGTPRPIPGRSAGVQGSPGAGTQQSFLTFYTLGIGTVPDVSAGAYHIQQFSTIGPSL